MTCPVRSMTGFARVSGRVSETLGFSLTLKSVNHRFLDLHLRVPSGADALEMQLRRRLKEKLTRGHVEVTLSVDRAADKSAHYDSALIANYIAAFRAAARENELDQQPDLNSLLRIPGVFTAEGPSIDANLEAIERSVMEQIDPAIEALNDMREREGAALREVIRACLDRLGAQVGQVTLLREGVQHAYFERVSQRLSTLLAGSFDEARVLQEAAMLAERSDVDEEITRLRTHIDHFHTLLTAGGDVGKKSDFLLQEMNREANTLLSKTGGVSGNGSLITDLGLGMKAEIEKTREQVQNLE